MANTHLAYPDLALDKVSGTGPDHDAEAFIRLLECKFNFALGTESDEADAEHAIYLFRKKACFSSHCYQDRQVNGLGAEFKMQWLVTRSELCS